MIHWRQRFRMKKQAWLGVLTVIAIFLAFLNLSTKETHHLSDNSDTENFSSAHLITAEDRLLLRKNAKTPKIILFWTKFFGGPNSYMSEEGDRLRLHQCPESNCILTDDRSLWNESTALFFHPVDFSESNLPAERHPHQFYVFFLLESPYSVGARSPANFYNLTFTYRFDSDCIADNYLQYFRPPHLKKSEQLTKIWEKKRHDKAVIFLSNCGSQSRRMEYIQELNKYYPVDVFGFCGNNTCPRYKRDECDNLVSSYKFYLAFENSVCKDYLTEKAIRGYMADTIPVFLGGTNYSAVFPPKSFLDATDYATPEELANVMQKISSDRDAYLEYFQFRLNRRVNRLPDYLQPENVSLCKLCEIINSDNKSIIPRTYSNMTQWWNSRQDCYGPPWIPAR